MLTSDLTGPHFDSLSMTALLTALLRRAKSRPETRSREAKGHSPSTSRALHGKPGERLWNFPEQTVKKNSEETFKTGRSHQKLTLCVWGSSYRTVGDAGRKTPYFPKGQSASSEWARAKGRGRKGDRASRRGVCARAGNREGGHVCTLGNPTQAASRGSLGTPEGGEMARAGARRQKARLPVRSSSVALLGGPQHRANSSGKAHSPLVTSHKFQARQVLPKRPSVTEPQQPAPFTPVSWPRIETCKQEQAQGQSKTAGRLCEQREEGEVAMQQGQQVNSLELASDCEPQICRRHHPRAESGGEPESLLMKVKEEREELA